MKASGVVAVHNHAHLREELCGVTVSKRQRNMEFTAFNPSDSIPLYKVVLLGNVGVGKSSFFKRYRDGFFSEVQNDHGLDKYERICKREKETIKLQLWDTAGLERTGNLTEKYFRNCKAILLMYDLTDRSSYNDVTTRWKDYAERFCNDDVVYFVVGTKKDELRREITISKPKELSRDIPEENFFSISIKNGEEFEKCISFITDKLIASGTPTYKRDRFHTLTLSDEHNIKKIRSKCCKI